MPVCRRPLCSTALIAALASSVQAQGAGGPAPRPLGPVIATSTVDLMEIRNVRHLSDGRVLVNDGRRRLVWMLDASLRNPKIIIDSTAGTPNNYGGNSGGLLQGLADTSLFVDRTSQTFLVLDPAGKVVRVMSLPPATVMQLVINLTNPANGAGTSVVSPRYGFVFVPTGGSRPPPQPPAGAGDSAQVTVENTSTLVGMNVETRAIDTLATLVSGSATVFTFVAGRPPRPSSLPRMFPGGDEWAVTTDGSIAVVRTHEYRIEWLGADGSRTTSARLPFPWRRFSDEDKRHMVDSINTAAKELFEERKRRQAADTSVRPRTVTADGRVLVTPSPGMVPPTYYEPAAMPDYLPPVLRGTRAMMGDGDNNVWIHVSIPGADPAFAVYDVVNRKGELADRVKLPAGRTLVGFGTGGIVYLIAQDGGKPVLEKVRFRQ